MKSFADKNKQVWDIELNIGAAIRLKSRLGIDIENVITLNNQAKPEDISVLEKISSDAIFLFNIIYVLCEKQCKERNLSEEDFAESFDAESIELATEALLDEIVNFSRPAKRKVLEQLRRISREFSAKAGQKLDEVLMDPEFQKTIELELEKAINESGK